MLNFSVSINPIGPDEQSAFSTFLHRRGLDAAIWDVYNSFLNSSSPVSHPRVLRAYDNDRIAGLLLYIVCRQTGRCLFDNPLLASLCDSVRVPVYLWIRQGVCADVFSNPGFVADGYEETATLSAMLAFLKKKAPYLYVTDYLENAPLHPDARRFSYVKEGAISLSGIGSIHDFLAGHKNLKRKLRTFVNKGGEIVVHQGALDPQMLEIIRNCVDATVEKSVIHSPFQDHFSNMVIDTCRIPSDRILHFFARRNGRVLGYHSFLQTGDGLRMIHGAFDRSLDSTYHAYENIMVAAASHALNHGLDMVHFGPIFNETKRRLVNRSFPINVFLYSNNFFLRTAFPALYAGSKLQSKKLATFS